MPFWDHERIKERPPDPWDCPKDKDHYCCVDPVLLVNGENNICLRWWMVPYSTICQYAAKACCSGIIFGGEIEFKPPTKVDENGNPDIDPEEEPFVDEHDKPLLGRAFECDYVKDQTDDTLENIKEFLRELDQAGSIPIFTIPELGNFDHVWGGP